MEIKEKKKRLITAKELWEKGATHLTNPDALIPCLITVHNTRDNSIIYGVSNTSTKIEKLAEYNFKWTADRKTWHNMWIDEE